jgi:hypothetical protein
MFSRVVFAVVLMAAIAAAASAENLPHASITLQPEMLAPAATANAELFADVNARRVEVRSDGVTVVYAPAVDVIVARIDKEGEAVTGCVHDEQGVEEFHAHARRPVAVKPVEEK